MAGGQLYEGNKFQRNVTESARGRIDVSNLANRGVQEQLDQKKQEAMTLYEQGLKLSAAQSMDEAYNQYQNDPENLAAQLNKISEKMTSEIPDQATKIAFRTNFITQSGSLINRAQANYDKIQYQKKKSSYFDTIQANNKSIATALSNAFNGTGSPDDLVNYQTSIKQNIGLINARNKDGTYMFTDAQRLSMSNAVDKLAAQSFSAALNDMGDDKRNQVIQALENDSMILLQGEDNGEVKQLNLKDAFAPEVYADMKKSAKILDNKIKKQQLAEWRQNKAYSAMALMQDPSEQNYKIWEYYNQDASDEKKAKMQQIAGFVPDEETVTDFEGAAEAYDAVKEITGEIKTYRDSDENERAALENAAIRTVQRLQNTNHKWEIGEDGKPTKRTLSSEDYNKYVKMVQNALADRVYAKQMETLPDLEGVYKFAHTVLAGPHLISNNRIEKAYMQLATDVTNIAQDPNLEIDDKKRLINKRKREVVIDIIKEKYSQYIPAIKDLEFVENETVIPIGNKYYLFKGVTDNNMFVETYEGQFTKGK